MAVSSSSSSSTERSLLFVDDMPSSPASWHLPSRQLEPEQRQRQRQRWKVAGILSIATTILLGILGSMVVDFGGRRTVSSVTTTRETTAASDSTSNTIGSRRNQQDARYSDWEQFLAQKSTATTVLGVTATPATAAAAVVVSDSDGSATTTPPPLLYFNNSAAFARVTPADDFFHYQNGWEAQLTQALCAIATTDAMLNSLRDSTTPGEYDDFQLPIGTIYAPYSWADQSYTIATAPYHNPCVLQAVGGTVPNVEAVSHMGLGLTMVPHLANCFLRRNGYTATGYPALPVTTTATSAVQQRRMKERVITALQDPRKRVLLNYDRAGIGQQRVSGGHWSPLGAYHNRTDTFLIMDVAKYKYPMVWVSWEQLWNGAATLDLCSETVPFLTDDTNATTTTTTNDEEDANFNFNTIDWSLSNRDTIWKYIVTKCRPGHRGFVVIEPTM